MLSQVPSRTTLQLLKAAIATKLQGTRYASKRAVDTCASTRTAYIKVPLYSCLSRPSSFEEYGCVAGMEHAGA